jgi:hypothetical protein
MADCNAPAANELISIICLPQCSTGKRDRI